MIPLPPAVKDKIVSWLPHLLDGYDYPLIETDSIVPELAEPSICYYVASAGEISQFNAQCLRTVRSPIDQTMEEYWGQYHFATINVVLRAPTKAELEAMWYEFYARCLSTRRNLKIYLDRVRFLEILASKPLPPARLDNGQDLYWAQVDLRFEYEVSAVPDADYIKRVNVEMQVGPLCEVCGEPLDEDAMGTIEWTSEVAENELPVGIVAYIAPAAE